MQRLVLVLPLPLGAAAAANAHNNGNAYGPRHHRRHYRTYETW
jgi:hypothetical protein